jgi:putative membrane protein
MEAGPHHTARVRRRNGNARAPRDIHDGEPGFFRTATVQLGAPKEKPTVIDFRKSAVVAVLAAAFLSAQAQQGPSDPQIAHIVVTANQVDIDAGKLAKSRSKNKEVDKFAQQMITDHTGVNKQATALVKKLKVKPEPNDTSASLKKGGDESMAKLKKLKGAEFDKAYVDQEVAYHQAVLDAIDKTLIPSAKNRELKDLIVKVRPAIAAHLDHAKHLQAQLK